MNQDHTRSHEIKELEDSSRFVNKTIAQSEMQMLGGEEGR